MSMKCTVLINCPDNKAHQLNNAEIIFFFHEYDNTEVLSKNKMKNWDQTQLQQLIIIKIKKNPMTSGQWLWMRESFLLNFRLNFQYYNKGEIVFA